MNKNKISDNKLGITDQNELLIQLESICKIKSLNLESIPIPQDLKLVSPEFIKFIHYYLFREIFPLAGKFKRLNKEDMQLFPLLQIEKSLSTYFAEYQKTKSFSSLIEIFSFLCLFEPFEEGNGIVARIWLDLMLSKFHSCSVNWTIITKDHFLKAVLTANYDTSYIKYLIEQNLIKPPNSLPQKFLLTDANFRLSDLNHFKSSEIYKTLDQQKEEEATTTKSYIENDIDNLFEELLEEEQLNLHEQILEKETDSYE